ncbi:MAG: hypothetical protein K2W96_18185 [Gemmataceae bacterium]|nr:hypothetical protein [Gemmataceae bacterium]
MWRTILSAGLALGLSGCVSGPMVENPAPLRLAAPACAPNPGFVPQSQSAAAYARVFSRCLDVASDYFDLDPANTSRYAGVIRTFPRIAPGIEQPWKPGSPDFYQRLLAFTQTIRHRAIIEITTGQDGGYFVEVKVFKELEDLPAPSRATAGEATYRLLPTVERQFTVVEPGQFEPGWIPIGRDGPLEQVMLERITRLDVQK